ncbi:energy-coupling factor transport system permease protein [Clostridium cavendishii DSM 21758]|uniref:Energy-coupling factor transport system permease protein n=1 Tax=Clostridium cavendishii DSM 21758 TaxID=1121302 RepID=A0A1M6DGI7_9CLOT|nr:energy-coupling factor transporter transmembrane component T [Clostridium cavendishii]SHI72457.1 energy-coupling factor transport system permease protein [Clostridium cavendishii DSM 21758]
MKYVTEFKALKPDPRALIFQVIIISILNFLINRPIELLLLFVIMDILMLWHRMFKTAIKFTITYLLLYISNLVLVYLKIPLITMMFTTLIFLCFRLFPVYIACVILIRKVHMDELLFSLEAMYIPKAMVLPLAVVYRYIPTIKDEVAKVREGLKMRGLNTSFIGVLFHPMNAVENFIIPLLIRSGKISEELSAASLCKGLDTEHTRTSYTDVKFQTVDTFYCLMCLVISAILIIIHDKNIFA